MFTIFLVSMVVMVTKVSSTNLLSVTCSLTAAKDLQMSVSLASGSLTDYAFSYIVDGSNTNQAITDNTPIVFGSLTFDQTYDIHLTEGSDIEKDSDIDETWQCTRNLTAVAVDTDNDVNTNSDGSGSAKVSTSFTIKMTDTSDNTLTGTQALGTSVKLVVTQDANYQDDFWFHIEKLEIKEVDQGDSEYINFYNANNCADDPNTVGNPNVRTDQVSISLREFGTILSSLPITTHCADDPNTVGNPNVRTDQTEIFIPFSLFRLLVTSNLVSTAQTLVYKLTVKPCADQSTCDGLGCVDSPESGRRRRRDASEGDANSNLTSIDLYTTIGVLPNGVESTQSKTTGKEDDNDTLLEDGLCFGRAPVYAGAAILVALLITLMCFGFLFIAMRRRRSKDRLVEYPTPAQSVASVHGMVSSGKSSLRG